MKQSVQDRCYLEQEGDAFFRRNFAGRAPQELRDTKRSILDTLTDAGIRFVRVLEYGCNYGDLLAQLAAQGAMECVGVEASQEAICFGRQRYGETVRFVHGSIADNAVNRDPANSGRFDLVIVDDVFGWVSRETLFESIANIDGALADGGHLFIRDFCPDEKVKNVNHHVADGRVFNFKVPGSHSEILTASGMYEPVYRRIYVDRTDMSATYQSSRIFESRWADTILRKSLREYYNAHKPAAGAQP